MKEKGTDMMGSYFLDTNDSVFYVCSRTLPYRHRVCKQADIHYRHQPELYKEVVVSCSIQYHDSQHYRLSIH